MQSLLSYQVPFQAKEELLVCIPARVDVTLLFSLRRRHEEEISSGSSLSNPLTFPESSFFSSLFSASNSVCLSSLEMSSLGLYHAHFFFVFFPLSPPPAPVSSRPIIGILILSFQLFFTWKIPDSASLPQLAAQRWCFLHLYVFLNKNYCHGNVTPQTTTKRYSVKQPPFITVHTSWEGRALLLVVAGFGRSAFLDWAGARLSV